MECYHSQIYKQTPNRYASATGPHFDRKFLDYLLINYKKKEMQIRNTWIKRKEGENARMSIFSDTHFLEVVEICASEKYSKIITKLKKEPQHYHLILSSNEYIDCYTA